MEDSHGSDEGSRPDWWERNQRTRDQMDLPNYEPPRFADETYKYEIVPALEEEHDCQITFRSKNPHHPCEWDILVDGERVGTTGRQRTDHGNTVYEISSVEFERLVESSVRPHDSV